MKPVAYLNVLLVFALFFVGLTATAQDDVQSPRSEDYMLELRDGVKLATTAYFPEGDGPWPIVLTRTPYNKTRYGPQGSTYTKVDYVFVIQDCRGRFASEGEYVPFETDMEDGYDTVEWLASQSFSNGKIGMTGASAMGITSNLAAAANPPHLVAAYVIVAPQSLFSESRFIGGVFKESHAGGWMRSQGVADQIPGLKARVVMDDHWKEVDLVHHLHKIDIPIYNVGGWYDIFLQGNIDNFKYLQEKGLEGAKGNQKLFMGAFGHGNLSGDLEYPGGGSLRGGDEVIRWFDYWLKGIDNGIMDEPAVTYYMMASAQKGNVSAKNRLVRAGTWPPETVARRFYLHEGLGLQSQAPSSRESSTSYRHDPDNPVDTVGGANLRLPKGPMDQREIGQRGDYLRFLSDPLEEDLAIAGSINFELYAATDGPDTDFMIKLVDVYPDGYEAIVVDCPLRTRYRHGREREDVEMMTPGAVEKLEINMWSTALTFEKGHRIAVHVSSSNFPRFEVNANTGEAPGKSEMTPRIARNTIYHDASHPTAIILPVLKP